MTSYFTFEGDITVRQKFKVEIIARNYEEAVAHVEDMIFDLDAMEKYLIGNPEIEGEIDTYDETPVPQF